MLGVAIIMIFSALGVWAGQLMGFPGALTGLLLLAAALGLGLVREQWLEGGGDLFLNHLTLFFIPAALGIMDHLGLLGKHLPAILLIIAVSTILTLAVTGWVAQWASGGQADDS